MCESSKGLSVFGNYIQVLYAFGGAFEYRVLVFEGFCTDNGMVIEQLRDLFYPLGRWSASLGFGSGIKGSGVKEVVK